MKILRSILLIDDDSDDIETFFEAVAEIDESIICTAALNCDAALSALKEMVTKPDLIFLDLNLPKINGKQCLVLIKKDPDHNLIPVFIYSTSKIQSDIQEMKSLGASGFISKPGSFKSLKKTLSEIFSYEENLFFLSTP